ncbi:MAG TPA: sigma-70 family RNA polymerase sigma factor, partial [Pyrinomonadaceae bacterium]|nr:sigma-70 family RNA polymerase sigma factor [Pyrinomonadaceae bacterium]
PFVYQGVDEGETHLQAAAVKPLRLVTNQPASELENLFQAHHGRVFRTAQRITGSVADAEDVLQTVFLRLVKGKDDYDWSRNPEAYLSRAAINASLDLLRSRTRSRAVALDDNEVDSIAGTYQSPETVHADRELQTLVRQAVSRLGKTAGEMFVLRYYEGYDNKDIATIMNTSPLVVGVVLHRARTRLKKEIGHYLEKHHEE